MSVKRLPKTREFVTIDEIGKAVLILEYTEMIGVDNLDNGDKEIPGAKQYFTAANERVNENRNDTYLVLGNDVLLRRLPNK